MAKKRLRFVITCPRCNRLYKRFVPIPAKKNTAVCWCLKCDIVLCRFDMSNGQYDEDKDFQ